MKTFREDIKYFGSNKIYAVMVLLTATFSYGFEISHEAIGIDDTCIPLYFQEGLAPAVGRWTLYLVNKLFFVADFAPWVTELAGVILMLLSATVWCVVFYRALDRRECIWGYSFFASLFISCPLISEIYVYYLHNGISLAYGLTGISLLLVLEAMKAGNKRTAAAYIVGSSAFLAVALGCYESFMIVFAIGMLLTFLLVRGFGEGENGCCRNPWIWVLALLAAAICSVIFRALALKLVLGTFHIGIPESFRVEYRSVFDFDEMTRAEFFMTVKRFFVKYYLNAFAYLPITVLVLGILTLLAAGIVLGIRRKDVFLPLAALAIPVVPACMVIIEGKETYYRAAQYVPLLGAFAVLLLFVTAKARPGGKGLLVGIFFAAVLLWNQCTEMNKWFYVDYLKYQDARSVMEQVAYDLEKEYDTEKPVIFRGAYYVPYGIAKDAYLDYDSLNYRWIRRLGDMIDIHLIEKYNAEDGHGYVFAETPVNSTIRWGVTAFDGTAGELENFMRMLGHDITVETDLEKIDEAEGRRIDMPQYPEKGYIREYEDYIIVNF